MGQNHNQIHFEEGGGIQNSWKLLLLPLMYICGKDDNHDHPWPMIRKIFDSVLVSCRCFPRPLSDFQWITNSPSHCPHTAIITHTQHLDMHCLSHHCEKLLHYCQWYQGSNGTSFRKQRPNTALSQYEQWVYESTIYTLSTHPKHWPLQPHSNNPTLLWAEMSNESMNLQYTIQCTPKHWPLQPHFTLPFAFCLFVLVTKAAKPTLL